MCMVVKAWDLWTSNKVLDLIDPVMLEDASSMHIMLSRYVNIALFCVQERPEDRPTMSDIESLCCKKSFNLTNLFSLSRGRLLIFSFVISCHAFTTVGVFRELIKKEEFNYIPWCYQY